jgi:AsmA-like C-terminal region
MRRRRWLRLALAVMAFMLAASAGLSRALEDGWARHSLLERLSASFGRPVEVGHFGFSLLGGPRLEADSVTVAENPAFGQEYFLRAEQLAVSLRWSALLHGRLEFGTVSFARPTLNLVRIPDGRWNIASWLPPPGPVGVRHRAAPRFTHIEIEEGRINFKRANEKLPFALVDVTGRLDQDSSGRWRIDLRADPMRAPVILQDIGTLRLRGVVSGTSARLRPASLTLSWQDASLADVLRLAHGSDSGFRGTLSAEATASIQDPPRMPQSETGSAAWIIAAAVHLAGMHRWDLPGSGDDPALQVTVGATWRPGQPRLDITRCIVEAPHSRLFGTGGLDWSKGFAPRLRIASSRIGLEDLGAWRRAFLPHVADGLEMQGTLGVDAQLAGWPPRIQQAAIAGTGATLHLGASLPSIRVGRLQAALRQGSLVLDPLSVILPGTAKPGLAIANASASPGVLRVEATLGPVLLRKGPGGWRYRLTIAGQTVRVEHLAAMAAALGWRTRVGWKLEGPASLRLAWTGTLRQGITHTRGTLTLRRLRLTSVLLNRPLIVSSATVAFRPGERRVRLAGAQAFGANWKGTLDWRAAEKEWTFDLSADRLVAADLDRWLGPRARPTLLERMLPFASATRSASGREAAIAQLQARGRLRVGEVILAPLRIRNLDTRLDLDGRGIVLRDAQAGFYGGHVDGQFEARLDAKPSYAFDGRIDAVNLAALTSVTNSLVGRFAGFASGKFALATRGIGRQALLASLEGEGDLRIHNAVVRRFRVAFGPQEAIAPPAVRGESRFDSVAAKFHLAAGSVRLDRLVLGARERQKYEVAGSVDFARRLNLTVRSVPPAEDSALDPDAVAESDAWTIGGTLDAPQVTRQTRIARNRVARSGAPR